MKSTKSEKYKKYGFIEIKKSYLIYILCYIFLFLLGPRVYIVVQQSTTVSLTGWPVLRTLYKPMSMNKSNNSQNCEFCVL